MAYAPWESMLKVSKMVSSGLWDRDKPLGEMKPGSLFIPKSPAITHPTPQYLFFYSKMERKGQKNAELLVTPPGADAVRLEPPWAPSCEVCLLVARLSSPG